MGDINIGTPWSGLTPPRLPNPAQMEADINGAALSAAAEARIALGVVSTEDVVWDFTHWQAQGVSGAFTLPSPFIGWVFRWTEADVTAGDYILKTHQAPSRWEGGNFTSLTLRIRDIGGPALTPIPGATDDWEVYFRVISAPNDGVGATATWTGTSVTPAGQTGGYFDTVITGAPIAIAAGDTFFVRLKRMDTGTHGDSIELWHTLLRYEAT